MLRQIMSTALRCGIVCQASAFWTKRMLEWPSNYRTNLSKRPAVLALTWSGSSLNTFTKASLNQCRGWLLSEKILTADFEMTELNYAWSILYCLGSFILIAIYLVASSLVQYWRLRRIPGPPVAAWTNLWLMWHMNSKKTFHAVQKRLHQEYGPMQRYGPNRVMFSDLSAVPIILGTSNIFLKVPALM